MVGRENQQIVLPEKRHQLPQLLIEFLQFPGIAHHIPAMTPQRVEIHQIHIAKPSELPLRDLDGLLHAVYRAFGLVGLREALPVKNIENLPHGYHVQTCVLQGVQGRPSVGLQGIVMAVAGALELAPLLSHIRPGNHPP